MSLKLNLTVEEFAARHNVSNNQAKRMMRSKKHRGTQVDTVVRGVAVKGTGKPNASTKG